jgi:hypothetical protein
VVTLEGVHCSLAIRRAAPRVVVLTIEGTDAGELGDRPFRELEKEMNAPGTFQLFIDARATRGASIDVSGEWAKWLRENQQRLELVNMLTGTAFVRITADFVRMSAGLGDRMRIYTDASAFEEALASACRQ